MRARAHTHTGTHTWRDFLQQTSLGSRGHVCNALPHLRKCVELSPLCGPQVFKHADELSRLVHTVIHLCKDNLIVKLISI
jgi:hypothetical protein